MKILHTADWHMNDQLGRVDRSAEIFAALETIAGYLEEHEVDVMLVAGDLFSERSRPEQTRAAILKLKELFLPFLSRGGTILAISGNHDSEVFFETLRDALDLVAPGKPAADATHAVGRLYLSPNPRVIKLADPSGQIVQFALMPYPTARCYLRGQSAEYSNIEEKHRAVQDAFTGTLQTLIAKNIDSKLPAVLVSHVHVRGAQTHTLYKVSEVEDVVFDPTDIPAHWAYVAYGHIHKPQTAVPGAEHIRYCGSIIPFDFAERGDEKQVVLLEVDAEGLKQKPQILPLPSTPLYHVEINDPDSQLAKLEEEYSDHERALVNYTLHWEPGKHSRERLSAQVNAIFPNWYARQFVEVGRDTMVASYTPQQMQDVVGTVRDYLKTNLRTHAQRESLVSLAEAMLAEEGFQELVLENGAADDETGRGLARQAPEAEEPVSTPDTDADASLAYQAPTDVTPSTPEKTLHNAAVEPPSTPVTQPEPKLRTPEPEPQPSLWGDDL